MEILNFKVPSLSANDSRKFENSRKSGGVHQYKPVQVNPCTNQHPVHVRNSWSCHKTSLWPYQVWYIWLFSALRVTTWKSATLLRVATWKSASQDPLTIHQRPTYLGGRGRWNKLNSTGTYGDIECSGIGNWLGFLKTSSHWHHEVTSGNYTVEIKIVQSWLLNNIDLAEELIQKEEAEALEEDLEEDIQESKAGAGAEGSTPWTPELVSKLVIWSWNLHPMCMEQSKLPLTLSRSITRVGQGWWHCPNHSRYAVNWPPKYPTRRTSSASTAKAKAVETKDFEQLFDKELKNWVDHWDNFESNKCTFHNFLQVLHQGNSEAHHTSCELWNWSQEQPRCAT